MPDEGTPWPGLKRADLTLQGVDAATLDRRRPLCARALDICCA